MCKLALLLCVCVVQLFSAGVWAQSNRATITRTVTDPTGAVVAEVEVQATNVDTGVIIRTLSNDVGI